MMDNNKTGLKGKPASSESTDEVDCCAMKAKMLESNVIKAPPPDLVNCAEKSILAKQQQQQQENNCKGIFGDAICNKNGAQVLKTSPLEKLNIFASTDDKSGKQRKRSEPLKSVMRPKFVKSASIARLLGNNYATATADQQQPKSMSNGDNRVDRSVSNSNSNNSNNNSGCNKSKLEKFHKCTDKELIEAEDEDVRRRASFSAPVISENDDLPLDGEQGGSGHHMSHNSDIRRLRALRSLTKGLGKLLRRRTDSVEISQPDPEYKVSYLGNVLTGWAKGDGCFEKPLSTLWRNYTQNNKPDVLMKIKVCPSGLKATTKQHGLTEYWSNRITFCSSPKNYPRVFCWIYRHEGRRMKHELRCHAVVCSKDTIAKEICSQLQDNLYRALKEFKRDKISRQNARLSLANCVYENPTMPRRKLMLSVGGNNYRPPLERSKSAPKLMAIEEDDDEEDEMAVQQRKSPMTLGRSHWLNRKETPAVLEEDREAEEAAIDEAECEQRRLVAAGGCADDDEEEGRDIDETEQEQSFKLTPSISRYDDDEEDEDGGSEIAPNDLEGEIMSYFDKKLNEKATSMENMTEIRNGDRRMRNYSVDCLLDTDEIISQLIRSRPPSVTFGDAARGPQDYSLDSFEINTPPACDPDRPQVMPAGYKRTLFAEVDEMAIANGYEEDEEGEEEEEASRFSPTTVDSDESLSSSIIEGAAVARVLLSSQYSEESQLEMDLRRPSSDEYFGELATTAVDTDSDVSDESGFIEDNHNKFPLSTKINKVDNSILV